MSYALMNLNRLSLNPDSTSICTISMEYLPLALLYRMVLIILSVISLSMITTDK